jgi:hypothetical protein
MTNEELKALALAATPSKWTTDGEKTVMSAESDQLNAGYAIFECHGPDALKNAEFAAATNPVVVLGLIADAERNQRMLLAACTDMGAIGEALGADMNSDGDELLGMVTDLIAERDKFKAELKKVKADRKACWAEFKVQGRYAEQMKTENADLRDDSERLVKAAAFVQKLCDAAGEQPSVATGYLHDILGSMRKEASNG